MISSYTFCKILQDRPFTPSLRTNTLKINLKKRETSLLYTEGVQFKTETSNILLHSKYSFDTLNTLVFLRSICIRLPNKKIQYSCGYFVSNRALLSYRLSTKGQCKKTCHTALTTHPHVKWNLWYRGNQAQMICLQMTNAKSHPCDVKSPHESQLCDEMIIQVMIK